MGCQRSRRRPGRRASPARPVPRLRIATGVKCHPHAVAGLRAQVTLAAGALGFLCCCPVCHPHAVAGLQGSSRGSTQRSSKAGGRQRAGEEQHRDREGQDEGAEQNQRAAEGRGWVWGAGRSAVAGPRLPPPPSPDAPTRALHTETATANTSRFSTGCLTVALLGSVGTEAGGKTHAGGAPAGRCVEYQTVRVLRPADACPLPMLSPCSPTVPLPTAERVVSASR